jgi:predicted unusual protein kinase regulating ubiquinone biosynthesis (AarF/ABC1/UbiB family)
MSSYIKSIVDIYNLVINVKLSFTLIKYIDELVLLVTDKNIEQDDEIIRLDHDEYSNNLDSKSESQSESESESDLIYQQFEDLINKINNQIQLISEKGCIYIKFCQWLVSNKLTPFPNIMKRFENIFDQCPYHNDQFTIDTIRDDLGMTQEELNQYLDFSSLERIASGSIGQVYKCKLINPTQDYEYVIIKIKHPSVDEEAKDFSKLVSWFTYLQGKSYFRRKLCLYFDFEEFMNNINSQIDFNIEANNGKKFRELYADSNTIYFPEILKYSRNVLIAEYVEKVEFEALSDYQKSFNILNLCGFMFDSLLTTNFCHGDLHCKNWSLIENKDNNTKDKIKYKLVIFDYGICYSSKSCNFNQKLYESLEHGKVYNIVSLIKHSRGLIDISEYIDNDTDIEIDQDLYDKLAELDDKIKLPDSYGMFMLVTKILEEEDIIICKFLMNTFIILFMVDQLLIKNNIHREINYGNQLCNHLRDVKLDVLAYCKSKKTYPRLIEYLEVAVKSNKYNLDKIDSDEELTVNLFNSIESSKLKFKPIIIE